MKILLVCAGGMSTSILMKKMEKYWETQNIPLEIQAVGLADYLDACKGCDCVLVGPQVSYRLKEIKDNVGCPCDSIPNRGAKLAKSYIEHILKIDKKVKYIAKLDIHHFFDSVRPNLVYKKLEHKIKDKQTLNLARIFLYRHNSLPIGYYTSQWLSNFFLEDLDH